MDNLPRFLFGYGLYLELLVYTQILSFRKEASFQGRAVGQAAKFR